VVEHRVCVFGLRFAAYRLCFFLLLFLQGPGNRVLTWHLHGNHVCFGFGMAEAKGMEHGLWIMG
jgi:hypothetical protein